MFLLLQFKVKLISFIIKTKNCNHKSGIGKIKGKKQMQNLYGSSASRENKNDWILF